MKTIFKGVQKHIERLGAEQLRAEYSRLADEMLSLDFLVHSLAQGIIVLDERGEVTKANPAAKAILGMEAADALASLAIPLGVASKKEIEITYPDAKTIELSTQPIGTQTLVLLRDVTAEKERSEEELRVGATRAVRDLASGVAHEIGNPLNALAMNLQLIERCPEDAVEIAKESQLLIKRLDGILKGFLQAMRPSKPVLLPGNVADPLKRCLTTLRAQFEERKISVTLDVPGTLPATAIDKDQMEQVFFNLLKNALEAIRDGGLIAVTLAYDDNDVLVTFRDNGVGMDEETVIHLFEPYRTTKEHGTGLGLMISQRIVRDHGGSIAVESKKGDGTCFTIRLPRLERRIRALGEK